MTEHEKLKEICDLIGYKCPDKRNGITFIHSKRDVREIIFTPEFMKKLEDYCYSNIGTDLNMLNIIIMSNLRDPVNYIYITLGLGKQ